MYTIHLFNPALLIIVVITSLGISYAPKHTFYIYLIFFTWPLLNSFHLTSLHFTSSHFNSPHLIPLLNSPLTTSASRNGQYTHPSWLVDCHCATCTSSVSPAGCCHVWKCQKSGTFLLYNTSSLLCNTHILMSISIYKF